VYDRGCTNNFLEVFCSRIEPSKNNFRGYVHEEALKSSKAGNIQVTEVDNSDGDRRVKVEEDLGNILIKIHNVLGMIKLHGLKFVICTTLNDALFYSRSAGFAFQF